MGWRHLRGRQEYSTVKIGNAAVAVGDLVTEASGVVTACAANSLPDGFMTEAGDAAATKKKMERLVEGSIYEAPVSSQTLTRGTQVTPTGTSSRVDTVGATEWAIGKIVDLDVGSSDTTARVFIERYLLPA